MRLGRLKDIIGFSLVGLHLLAIGLCFWLLKPRLTPEDFHLTVLILTPITAIFALAYVREVARVMLVGTTDEIDQKLVATRFSTLSIMFTLAFSLAVLYTIWDYARGNAQSADDLKISLSTIETALGAFLGLIVETLFGKVSPLPQKPETPLQAEA
ncbi:hypothetical protein SAMN04488498_1019 [Mesorhizobium albiziae]|uniref:Uncharacterized protein n=2 Tax=Neomesorhizobium albiziae TaxID=335020 RepID=A0A1I3UTJ4_9HYPH|nr:hypothetical protein SAMN04488498_1019 [Mesorhizobium albiziae]